MENQDLLDQNIMIFLQPWIRHFFIMTCAGTYKYISIMNCITSKGKQEISRQNVSSFKDHPQWYLKSCVT